MANKRKKVQKTNWRKIERYATTVAGVVVLLALATFFFMEATNNFIVYKNWDQDIFKEYTGKYELFYWGKNQSSYALQLENGDTVLIRSHTCENREKFSETDQIYVKYSPYKATLLQGHNPVCVTSSDGNVVFVSAETQKSEARIFILFYILGSSVLAIPIMGLCLEIREIRFARKYLSKKKKKNKKNQKA